MSRRPAPATGQKTSSNPNISYVDDRRRGRGTAAAAPATKEAAPAPATTTKTTTPAAAKNQPSDPKKGKATMRFDEAQELPPHACAYCGFHEDVRCVARCADCNKWFCNGKGQLTVSHIVAHCARAGHKSIAPHPDSEIGGDVLECYQCESKNIFDLGLAHSGDDDLLFVCREPCLHHEDIAELGVNTERWVSLIENRQLMAQICQIPAASAQAVGCRQITPKELQFIEDAWRLDPSFTVEQALEVTTRQNIIDGRFKFLSAPKVFRDGEHLKEMYLPLIDDECEKTQAMDDAFCVKKINVKWFAQHGHYMAVFTIPSADHALSVGRPVRFKNEKTSAEYETVLIHSMQGDRVVDTIYKAELSRGSPQGGNPVDGDYTITLIFNPVTYDRMRDAIGFFAKDGGKGKYCGKQIYNTIIGKRGGQTLFEGRVPDNLDAPGVAQLNEIQRKAVADVLLRPLSLIQGPPGTGKTTTTATIVYHLSKMFQRQILVCAPSNIAVDELSTRIAKTGLNVVRLVARSREDASVDENLIPLTLHYRVEQTIKKSHQHEKLRDLTSKRREQGTLNSTDYDAFITLQKKLEEKILNEADVICCTSVVAADKRIEKFLFRHVVIDESTQSHEPETLIPIMLGAEQVILIGDHCQMGPVVMSRDAGEAGLSRTMFERLVTLGHKPHRLEIQYRMHPELSKFSSNMFYDGTLQNGVTSTSRDSSKCFPWPDPSKPFFFFHTTNPEEMGSTGISVLNRREAHLAEKMLTLLLKNNVKPSDIGVITPYEAQRNYLITYMQRNGQYDAKIYNQVEVASVDSFQGREKDFIILSCVRSNDNHAIGFLKDWRRLNVALTRARRGVMVIGNATILADDPTWNAFLIHCQTKKLIVMGSVEKPEPVDIDIPPPKKRNRKNGISEETLALVRGLTE